MVKIELIDLEFESEHIPILHKINLTINDGEYVTFVGPTGSGKTTLMALIAGLYQPKAGKILFDGKDVTNLPSNQRKVGYMFESYALFPHLNISDNVGYARHVQGKNRDVTYKLASDLLQLVRIPNRDKALPKECSGGMQQRVALARALSAMESSGILILDEPFKALDAGLRLNLRREVRNIVKSDQFHMTTLHVTNDVQEAMLADRIVVMKGGRVEQFSIPHEVLNCPNNVFVANFFSGELNHFSGKIIAVEPVKENLFRVGKLLKVIIISDEGFLLYVKTEKQFTVGEEVTFLIRSSYYKARHHRREDKTNSIVGTVKRVKFMGAWLRMEVECPFRPDVLQQLDKSYVPPQTLQTRIIKAEVPTTRTALSDFTVGETITLYYNSEYVIVFPRISRDALERELRVS